MYCDSVLPPTLPIRPCHYCQIVYIQIIAISKTRLRFVLKHILVNPYTRITQLNRSLIANFTLIVDYLLLSSLIRSSYE